MGFWKQKMENGDKCFTIQHVEKTHISVRLGLALCVFRKSTTIENGISKNESKRMNREEHEQRRIKNVISKNWKHKKKNEIKKKMF